MEAPSAEPPGARAAASTPTRAVPTRGGASCGRPRSATVACRLAAVGALALAVAGCTSVWQESYRPSPLAHGAEAMHYPRQHRVVVREAPWERVQATLRELEDEEADSPVHVSEWTEDQRSVAKAKILSALQITDPPESVVILGSSSFRTTDNVRPEDGTLESMARRLGADYAIWTSRYAGRGTRIVDRPVTVHNHGWTRYYDRDDHAWRNGYFSDLDTAWVPVPIDADRYAFIAFFVRKR